jgi:hypothetical protein
MTVKEFAEILADLDAYIARGGRLLDVAMVPWQELPVDDAFFRTDVRSLVVGDSGRAMSIAVSGLKPPKPVPAIFPTQYT